MSVSWNTYSIIIIYGLLIIIVLLELLDVNNLIVVFITVLGLTSLLIVARIQAARLRKRLLQEEKQDFTGYFPDSTVNDVQLTPLSKAETNLTQREFEVLSNLVSGKSNKEIAGTMNISVQTIKNHVTHIFNKLDVYDRTSLVILAMNKGWVKNSDQSQRHPIKKRSYVCTTQ